jgi:hypothetical protein
VTTPWPTLPTRSTPLGGGSLQLKVGLLVGGWQSLDVRKSQRGGTGSSLQAGQSAVLKRHFNALQALPTCCLPVGQYDTDIILILPLLSVTLFTFP